MGALLVDTCDRPADAPPPRPVDLMLAEWGKSLSAKSPRDRAILASARQGWIDEVKFDLYGDPETGILPCPRRMSKALNDLAAANLRATDIPTVQDWLQRVIKTGEVPA